MFCYLFENSDFKLVNFHSWWEIVGGVQIVQPNIIFSDINILRYQINWKFKHEKDNVVLTGKPSRKEQPVQGCHSIGAAVYTVHHSSGAPNNYIIWEISTLRVDTIWTPSASLRKPISFRFSMTNLSNKFLNF